MAKLKGDEPFSLGRVVWPAMDGLLRDLGYEVDKLGHDALGLVMDSRGSKALVNFPALRLSTWLSTDEMADVGERIAAGDEAYRALKPERFDPEAEIPIVWWVRRLLLELPVQYLLAFEVAPLSELWDESSGQLADYYEGDVETPTAYVGLGIPELKLEDWRRAESLLGSKLRFGRFLPAGLSKIEMALYLRA